MPLVSILHSYLMTYVVLQVFWSLFSLSDAALQITDSAVNWNFDTVKMSRITGVCCGDSCIQFATLLIEASRLSMILSTTKTVK